MNLEAHNNLNNKENLPFLYEAGIVDDLGNFKSSFYLLGSQHNLPKDLVAKDLEDLIFACDILIKEITFSPFGDASDISFEELKLHGLAFDKNAADWTKHLSESSLKNFEEIKVSIKNAWDVDAHQISPVIVKHVISDWCLGEAFGEGMDTFIENQFIADDKPVFSLENGKVRFDSYDTLFQLSHQQRKVDLMENLSLLDQTISSWKNGIFEDYTPDFTEYFSGEMPEKCDFDKSEALCKRNLAWVFSMRNYLKRFPNKNLLFIFGFAHLGGPYGIIKLLENLGFTVKKCDLLNKKNK